ncbi:hypothetical protein [Lactobacillus gigeriorum]|uniref:Integral membrane protein n=1 Tax=Lactobacillus gigeriorum DSM 23908 = CRBIP 24.85 TaxID=1423751 RepID=I7LFN1_9LACO|nr:hypothetical protein [Lactobacillus gigeriorum]KRN14025.1 hypothetical protein FC38_GL001613 [Lactobacillus gigeriorum DSM 23908 = CRBIP 24.85]CCI86813.1 Putative uncharacterized protein [Lactobacillus gigeriorum DSM 23908 = CRBIP 24.85]
MENVISLVIYLIMLSLGIFELYRTYKFYKWDQSSKENPMAPAVIYYGGYFGVALVSLSTLFFTGAVDIKLGHLFYIIVGICIMLVSILIFRRGRQMSKKLKKDESNLAVVQVYVIAAVLFFTGFVNLFK